MVDIPHPGDSDVSTKISPETHAPNHASTAATEVSSIIRSLGARDSLLFMVSIELQYNVHTCMIVVQKQKNKM